MNPVKSIENLSKTEKTIWLISLITIIFSSCLFGEIEMITLIASVIGATALIFVGKGDAIGQLLTVLRSPYYALCYAVNDIVLIVLWVLATIIEIGYLPMVICFMIFLINDLYGFANWKRMKTRQDNKWTDTVTM